MKLNPDIYFEIFPTLFESKFELIGDRDLKFTNFFMFSGKEPLVFLVDFIKRVKSFAHWNLCKNEGSKEYLLCGGTLFWVSTQIIVIFIL